MLCKHTTLEIAKRLQIACDEEKEIGHFAINSKECQEGSLFFALKGNKVDGHSFLLDAKEKGAIAAIVQESYEGPSYGLTLLRCQSPELALQKLAQKIREERGFRIVGVTGSVGKTTTKEFIAKILEKHYRVGKNIGSQNSQLTLPLTILNLQGDEEVVVLEMGMSKEGEIANLVQIAPPELAVITRIGLQHVKNFPEGIEGIARAKSEILSHYTTKNLIINQQALGFGPIQEKKVDNVFSYSLADEMALEKPTYTLFQSLGQFYIEEKGKMSPPLHVPFPYSHFLENMLGAVAVARYFNLSWGEIEEALPSLTTIEKRFEPVAKNGVLYMNDSYNNSPDSLRAALVNLPSPARNRKRIGVIGAMKELGPFSESLHKEMGQIALRFVDVLFCHGIECAPMIEAFEESGREAHLFENLLDLKQKLEEEVEEGDVVLVKGSNASQMWQLLN